MEVVVIPGLAKMREDWNAAKKERKIWTRWQVAFLRFRYEVPGIAIGYVEYWHAACYWALTCTRITVLG